MKAIDKLTEIIESGLYGLQARWKPTLTVLIVTVTTAFLVQSPFQLNLRDFKPGDIAEFDIKAPEKLSVVDEDVTENRRMLAAESIPDVYDLDSKASDSIASRLKDSFSIMKSKNTGDSQRNIEEFAKRLGIQVSVEEWEVLRKNRFSSRIQHTIRFLTRSSYKKWVTENSEIPTDTLGKISVRDILTGNERTLTIKEVNEKIISLKDAQAQTISHKSSTWAKFDPNTRANLLSLATKLIDINLVLNQIETQRRKDESRGNVEPVTLEVARGEMIVREGARLNRRSALLLAGLNRAKAGRTNFKSFLGFGAFFMLCILLFQWIGRRNFNKFRITSKDQLVIGAAFVSSLALIILTSHLFQAAESQSNTGISLRLLIPIAFSGMVLRLFTSMEITTFFVLLLSTCVAWITREPFFGWIAFMSTLAGTARMRHITQRLDVFKAGLAAGGTKSLLVMVGLGMGLVQSPGFDNIFTNAFVAIGFCMASGVLSTVIVLGAQPLIEKIGYTTDLRLMELSNTNHPLLREMIIKAPGTYFHSFTVSQLAEKAAEAIRANSLFARVASLYHDIGKTKKPMYFIENIKGDNRHDKLVPSMSALIISNHVKDGIELGKKYGLPHNIIEVIPQHHGTSLISFFYDKAVKQAKEGDTVDEREFRYPGPKPQTKEAAIILLADAAEAAAKSLNVKTDDQIKQKVGQIIQRFFLDGQLDECDLSLKDLTAIGNAFHQVLQGVYHQRIDYPHLKQEKATKDEKVISRIPKTN